MRTLVVGRFQPLHLGHVRMIEYAAKKSDHLIVGLGSCNKSGTWENPFTAEERERMIKQSLELDIGYEIKRIPDFGDPPKWACWIKENIPFDQCMTNSIEQRKVFESQDIKTASAPFFNRNMYSASEVRKRIIEDTDWSKLLPVGTIKVINQVDGIHRIRELKEP